MNKKTILIGILILLLATSVNSLDCYYAEDGTGGYKLVCPDWPPELNKPPFESSIKVSGPPKPNSNILKNYNPNFFPDCWIPPQIVYIDEFVPAGCTPDYNLELGIGYCWVSYYKKIPIEIGGNYDLDCIKEKSKDIVPPNPPQDPKPPYKIVKEKLPPTDVSPPKTDSDESSGIDDTVITKPKSAIEGIEYIHYKSLSYNYYCDSDVDGYFSNKVSRTCRATFTLDDRNGDNINSPEFQNRGLRFCPSNGCLSSAGTDCNDKNNLVRPGLAETCDNKDNNCNGVIDEGTACPLVSYYFDKDDDGDFSNTEDGTCRGFQCWPQNSVKTSGTDCDDYDAEKQLSITGKTNSLCCSAQVDSSYLEYKDGNPLSCNYCPSGKTLSIVQEITSETTSGQRDRICCPNNQKAIKNSNGDFICVDKIEPCPDKDKDGFDVCDNINNSSQNQVDDGKEKDQIDSFEDLRNAYGINFDIASYSSNCPSPSLNSEGKYIFDKNVCNQQNSLCPYCINPDADEYCDGVDNNYEGTCFGTALTCSESSPCSGGKDCLYSDDYVKMPGKGNLDSGNFCGAQYQCVRFAQYSDEKNGVTQEVNFIPGGVEINGKKQDAQCHHKAINEDGIASTITSCLPITEAIISANMHGELDYSEFTSDAFVNSLINKGKINWQYDCVPKDKCADGVNNDLGSSGVPLEDIYEDYNFDNLKGFGGSGVAGFFYTRLRDFDDVDCKQNIPNSQKTQTRSSPFTGQPYCTDQDKDGYCENSILFPDCDDNPTNDNYAYNRIVTQMFSGLNHPSECLPKCQQYCDDINAEKGAGYCKIASMDYCSAGSAPGMGTVHCTFRLTSNNQIEFTPRQYITDQFSVTAEEIESATNENIGNFGARCNAYCEAYGKRFNGNTDEGILVDYSSSTDTATLDILFSGDGRTCTCNVVRENIAFKIEAGSTKISAEKIHPFSELVFPSQPFAQVCGFNYDLNCNKDGTVGWDFGLLSESVNNPLSTKTPFDKSEFTGREEIRPGAYDVDLLCSIPNVARGAYSPSLGQAEAEAIFQTGSSAVITFGTIASLAAAPELLFAKALVSAKFITYIRIGFSGLDTALSVNDLVEAVNEVVNGDCGAGLDCQKFWEHGAGFITWGTMAKHEYGLLKDKIGLLKNIASHEKIKFEGRTLAEIKNDFETSTIVDATELEGGIASGRFEVTLRREDGSTYKAKLTIEEYAWGIKKEEAASQISEAIALGSGKNIIVPIISTKLKPGQVLSPILDGIEGQKVLLQPWIENAIEIDTSGSSYDASQDMSIINNDAYADLNLLAYLLDSQDMLNRNIMKKGDDVYVIDGNWFSSDVPKVRAPLPVELGTPESRQGIMSYLTDDFIDLIIKPLVGEAHAAAIKKRRDLVLKESKVFPENFRAPVYESLDPPSGKEVVYFGTSSGLIPKILANTLDVEKIPDLRNAQSDIKHITIPQTESGVVMTTDLDVAISMAYADQRFTNLGDEVILLAAFVDSNVVPEGSSVFPVEAVSPIDLYINIGGDGQKWSRLLPAELITGSGPSRVPYMDKTLDGIPIRKIDNVLKNVNTRVSVLDAAGEGHLWQIIPLTEAEKALLPHKRPMVFRNTKTSETIKTGEVIIGSDAIQNYGGNVLFDQQGNIVEHGVIQVISRQSLGGTWPNKEILILLDTRDGTIIHAKTRPTYDEGFESEPFFGEAVWYELDQHFNAHVFLPAQKTRADIRRLSGQLSGNMPVSFQYAINTFEYDTPNVLLYNSNGQSIFNNVQNAEAATFLAWFGNLDQKYFGHSENKFLTHDGFVTLFDATRLSFESYNPPPNGVSKVIFDQLLALTDEKIESWRPMFGNDFNIDGRIQSMKSKRDFALRTYLNDLIKADDQIAGKVKVTRCSSGTCDLEYVDGTLQSGVPPGYVETNIKTHFGIDGYVWSGGLGFDQKINIVLKTLPEGSSLRKFNTKPLPKADPSLFSNSEHAKRVFDALEKTYNSGYITDTFPSHHERRDWEIQMEDDYDWFYDDILENYGGLSINKIGAINSGLNILKYADYKYPDSLFAYDGRMLTVPQIIEDLKAKTFVQHSEYDGWTLEQKIAYGADIRNDLHALFQILRDPAAPPPRGTYATLSGTFPVSNRMDNYFVSIYGAGISPLDALVISLDNGKIDKRLLNNGEPEGVMVRKAPYLYDDLNPLSNLELEFHTGMFASDTGAIGVPIKQWSSGQTGGQFNAFTTGDLPMVEGRTRIIAKNQQILDEIIIGLELRGKLRNKRPILGGVNAEVSVAGQWMPMDIVRKGAVDFETYDAINNEYNKAVDEFAPYKNIILIPDGVDLTPITQRLNYWGASKKLFDEQIDAWTVANLNDLAQYSSKTQLIVSCDAGICAVRLQDGKIDAMPADVVEQRLKEELKFPGHDPDAKSAAFRTRMQEGALRESLDTSGTESTINPLVERVSQSGAGLILEENPLSAEIKLKLMEELLLIKGKSQLAAQVTNYNELNDIDFVRDIVQVPLEEYTAFRDLYVVGVLDDADALINQNILNSFDALNALTDQYIQNSWSPIAISADARQAYMDYFIQKRDRDITSRVRKMIEQEQQLNGIAVIGCTPKLCDVRYLDGKSEEIIIFDSAADLKAKLMSKTESTSLIGNDVCKVSEGSVTCSPGNIGGVTSFIVSNWATISSSVVVTLMSGFDIQAEELPVSDDDLLQKAKQDDGLRLTLIKRIYPKERAKFVFGPDDVGEINNMKADHGPMSPAARTIAEFDMTNGNRLSPFKINFYKPAFSQASNAEEFSSEVYHELRHVVQNNAKLLSYLPDNVREDIYYLNGAIGLKLDDEDPGNGIITIVNELDAYYYQILDFQNRESLSIEFQDSMLSHYHYFHDLLVKIRNELPSQFSDKAYALDYILQTYPDFRPPSIIPPPNMPIVIEE